MSTLSKKIDEMIKSQVDASNADLYAQIQNERHKNKRMRKELDLLMKNAYNHLQMINSHLKKTTKLMWMTVMMTLTTLDVRVILNVSAAHLENFANLEEVCMAKGETLKDAMSGDVCVLNGDDPLVMSILVPVGVEKVTFLFSIVLYILFFMIKLHFGR
ncbi:hypothetical protein BC332_13075 [Capsicum chinense]|nr:hypothetical protein BC332_13075 [Capsicum chinense]